MEGMRASARSWTGPRLTIFTCMVAAVVGKELVQVRTPGPRALAQCSKVLGMEGWWCRVRQRDLTTTSDQPLRAVQAVDVRIVHVSNVFWCFGGTVVSGAGETSLCLSVPLTPDQCGTF